MASVTRPGSATKSQMRALLVAILIMLGIVGVMGWLVGRGLVRGETWSPTKRASSSRVIDRHREPVMFWAVVGLYGLVGCGAAGAAAWLAREGVRARSGVPRGGFADDRDGPVEDRPAVRRTMTLAEARALVAQTQSVKERAAAEQLLNEAVALPSLLPEERAMAFQSIRALAPTVPDYQLSNFRASVLETVGDSVVDRVVQKEIYAEALAHAQQYAASATSGGEGTARSMHCQDIEAKLRALDDKLSVVAAAPRRGGPADAGATPPVLPVTTPAPRSALVTAVGWFFIVAGGLLTPVSFISSLMILSGGDGSSGGTLLSGLVVIGGPPATLVAGIGLLLRKRWAYGYALALPVLFAGHSLMQICRGDTPEKSTVSPSGLITTTLAYSPNYTAHFLIIGIAVALLVKLSTRAVRAEFSS